MLTNLAITPYTGAQKLTLSFYRIEDGKAPAVRPALSLKKV